MKKYKRKTLVDLYRLTNKYWNTGDTDYLDTVIELSKNIDYRFWCNIESLVDLAVRKKSGIETLITAMRLFGYEVEG